MNSIPVIFANPWGAIGLIGIPVVIAIHCLQQKARILPVSTLFLMERLSPENREGRTLTRWRGSLPFWLQILSVLLLTWVLLQPHWLRNGSVQRVILVLDDSLSMGAFAGDIKARTSGPLHTVASLAPRTFWTVAETDQTRATLYEGFDFGALEEKLLKWAPSLPAHDPTEVLTRVRSQAPPEALVIFITDRPHETPPGVDTLAIGEPIENCGLTGSRISGSGDNLQWEVLVQNYGKNIAKRHWWIRSAGANSVPQAIDLEPGHPKILKGQFPPGSDRLEVCLDGDRFPMDDIMPIVKPQPKELTVNVRADDSTAAICSRLIESIGSLTSASPGRPADLNIITADPHLPLPSLPGSSIILMHDPVALAPLEGGPFTPERHALNQGLNWQGLVFQPCTETPLTDQDRVLLWKDGSPVIFLEQHEGGSNLVFNFNFPSSNAAKLPALVLLASRFVDSARAGKIAPSTGNVDVAQTLAIAASPRGPPLILHGPDGSESSSPPAALTPIRAPGTPGYFTITQGRQTLFTGAAEFADSRESDFAAAASFDTIRSQRSKLVELHSRPEALTPLWLLLLGALIIAYWYAVSPRPA